MNKPIFHVVIVLATCFFYAIGYLFDVEWLQFYYRNEYSLAEGRSLEMGGSILPIGLGVLTAFLVTKFILPHTRQ
ncbi:hypothetical protein [Halobacillus salinus]|uniref:hypothetical protein n=1 Tax=Halobacillus salinus TaxID=192814 RepID=UPI0009A7A8DA|nr:hypothetical protein [Halobacillus salinus]